MIERKACLIAALVAVVVLTLAATLGIWISSAQAAPGVTFELCSTLVSAGGDAAVQSAASGSFRDTTLGRQNEAPPAAKPKRR